MSHAAMEAAGAAVQLGGLTAGGAIVCCWGCQCAAVGDGAMSLVGCPFFMLPCCQMHLIHSHLLPAANAGLALRAAAGYR